MPGITETILTAHSSGHTASLQLLGSANSSRCQLSVEVWQWWSATQADLLDVVLHMGLLEVTYQRYLLSCFLRQEQDDDVSHSAAISVPLLGGLMSTMQHLHAVGFLGLGTVPTVLYCCASAGTWLAQAHPIKCRQTNGEAFQT